MKDNILWTPELEDEIDFQFITRVQKEVTQSCALPFAVPVDRIPEFIVQAAQYFWQNCDLCVEERYYVVSNDVTLSYSILKREMILTPNSYSHLIYGDADTISYGYTQTGLQANDTLLSIIPNIDIVEEYDQYDNAGKYTITLEFENKVTTAAVAIYNSNHYELALTKIDNINVEGYAVAENIPLNNDYMNYYYDEYMEEYIRPGSSFVAEYYDHGTNKITITVSADHDFALSEIVVLGR
jgi:hypothetical protein